ncbi:hypothetical protein ACFRU3_14330 [Streptomyces sp. NPDC056910]|uniref:hypothetical protein n=1 Tax=Streptomyces sp. NPDC056910 TaxID=3345964 RepID=UPI0036B7F488
MIAASELVTQSWYPTAQTGDGNEWITGRCWLYCRREGIRVTWIGPACTPNGERPIYACAVCIAELDYMVRDEQRRIDLGEPPARPDTGHP